MVIQITGDTGGIEPYDIYLCDTTGLSCFYISGNTTIPGTIYIDTQLYFPYVNTLCVIIVDTDGCVKTYFINCGTQKAFQDLIYFDFMDGTHYQFE